MRIVFDAYWWVEGPFSNRTVQREFINAWSRDFPTDHLVLMVPRAHLATAREDAPAGADLVGTRMRPHGIACAFAAPRIARQHRADIVIAHNFAPVVGASAVFIHDVLFQTNPEWFTLLERLYFRWIPALAARADVVLTSSETEASRIQGRNTKLGTVEAVGLAIRTGLVEAQPLRPDAVPADFVLTVGRLNVRKNLDTTIRAALDSGAVSAARPLVVIGETDGRAAAGAEQLRRAVDTGAVILLGNVTDPELAWLYRHASLFVFLSLDEGFGLTPVEAATFGCPCVVSDIPVFRETMGTAATYVSPLDAAAAAQAIGRLLAAPAVAPEVTPLSWSSSVARIRSIVLERVASRTPRV